MIVRILIAGFASLVGGLAFLSGLHRFMSGLLLGFGCIAAFFFGAIFAIPTSEAFLGFPVYGKGGSLPFFVLVVILAGAALFIVKGRGHIRALEPLSAEHAKFLGFGFVTCLAAVFVPAFFWFPSETKVIAGDIEKIGVDVFLGAFMYLAIYSVALYFLYRASRGGTEERPDFMRRIVLAIFSVLHFDKIPVLIAYLLIYSPDSQVIFPLQAALALYSYIPMAIFLWYSADDVAEAVVVEE